MPATEARAFRDASGEMPLQEWLNDLEQSEPRAHAKCLAVILELAAKGHELRRPASDALRDGIRELRTRVGRVHYRILYFFFGKHAACLSHGITKEDEVPDKDIELAIRRKKLVERDSERYTGTFE